jgi:hypothetical protein
MSILLHSYIDGSCDDTIFSSEDSAEKACQETFDLLSITLDPGKKKYQNSPAHCTPMVIICLPYVDTLASRECGEKCRVRFCLTWISSPVTRKSRVALHSVTARSDFTSAPAGELCKLTDVVFHFPHLSYVFDRTVISTIQNLIFGRYKTR